MDRPAGDTPGRMNVVSLSCVFPNAAETSLGLFVRARLERIAALARVTVVAPVLWFDYRKLAHPGGTKAAIPAGGCDGLLEVVHPRWIYVPGAGVLTAMLLFVQLLGPLYRLKKSGRCQLLDIHFGYPEGVAGCLLASVLRVPFTVTLRGAELLHGRYRLRRAAMRFALRRASCVIAVSEQLRAFAIALGVDPARTRTIPNGVNASMFFPRESDACRRKHNLRTDLPVVLTAGHLIELKGHQHVIRAVKQLADSGLPLQLVIAGGGPSRGVRSFEAELRRLTNELGLENTVRFMGAVAPEMLAELMSAADVFCLASHREGWPNVLHEALACGTPAVATRVGAVESLVVSEKFGIVVEPADPTALAAALRNALRKEWDRRAIAEWAHSRSWDQVATEVVGEMQRIVLEKETQQEHRISA